MCFSDRQCEYFRQKLRNAVLLEDQTKHIRISQQDFAKLLYEAEIISRRELENLTLLSNKICYKCKKNIVGEYSIITEEGEIFCSHTCYKEYIIWCL